MAVRSLAPTKTNLINLRKELGFAELGYELSDHYGPWITISVGGSEPVPEPELDAAIGG